MAVLTHVLDSSDVDLMLRVIALFDQVFEEEPIAPPGAPWLERLLASDAFVAVVAVDGDLDDEVVGAVTMHLMPNYRTGKTDGYVYDLGVAKSHRRRGIASDLMRALAAHAQARGMGDLWVQADAEDTWAVAFYESLGLEAEEVRHFEFTPEKLSHSP